MAIFFDACGTTDHNLVITHVNIIDVKTGEIAENKTVVIDSNKITAIYDRKIRYSKSTQVIDGRNKFLIPGLWDMHIHYYWNYSDSDPLLIANGITGVREMWGDMSVIKEIRRKTLNGEITAPDIYSSGTMIDGNPPYWQGSIGIATPEEAGRIVEKQIADGVDFIKVYSLLNEECFLAIAEIANERNIPFAGHIPDKVSIYKAIEAGMASSEHFFGILEASSSKEDSIMKLNFREKTEPVLKTFNPERFDSLCTVLAQSRMWICPTLVINRAMGLLNDTSFTNDSRLVFLPNYITSSWNPKNRTDEYYSNNLKEFQLQLSLIQKMNDKRIKFLAGTDFPNPYTFPGFSLHDELSLFVEGGMSALDALKASTINAAIFMGKDKEFGTVEVGKLASLVLLNKNPLLDIENSKTIEAVILRGKVYNRSALDKMLEEAKINATLIPYSVWLGDKISVSGIKEALDSLDIMILNNDKKYKLYEDDLNMLGYDLMQSGDVVAAQGIFKKKIELFPNSFNVYDSYAESCMKAGQYEEAIKHYKKLLELYPTHEGAKRMLDSLAIITDKDQILKINP